MSTTEHEVQIAPAPHKLADPDPVLLRAAEIVRQGWCQNQAWIGHRRCVLRALTDAGGGIPDMGRLCRSIGIDFSWLAVWNDAPERTQTEVVEALERAAWGL